MTRQCFGLLICLFLLGAECRTLNFVINHRQSFVVTDGEETLYVQLEDELEKRLGLEKPTISVKEFRQNEKEPDRDSKKSAIKVIDQQSSHIADESIDHSLDQRHPTDSLESELDNLKSDDEDYFDNEADISEDNHLVSDLDYNSDDGDLEDEDLYFNDGINNHYGDDVDEFYDETEEIDGVHRRYRKKRAADEQWKSSLPGVEQTTEIDDSEPDHWEAVTDDEVQQGKYRKYIKIAEYVGFTLLSVLGFVLIGYCFLRDPVACIFAFGTGCPCCLICCPCFRAFTDKYLDVKRLVKDSMNKYMPGVIVKEDGTLDYYEPTAEEVEILHEILEEIAGV